jgi:hypothetical protein
MRLGPPTVEDFGEAQLTSGHAYVRIDPAFADTMDQRSNYLVFITPEDDADALFVSQKSGSGFAVTESRGGRESIAFQYRIVAKPYWELVTTSVTFLSAMSERLAAASALVRDCVGCR